MSTVPTCGILLVVAVQYVMTIVYKAYHKEERDSSSCDPFLVWVVKARGQFGIGS
jgi:hypothetical protein